MIDIITRNIPVIIQNIKSSLTEDVDTRIEYYHRIIDSSKRQVIDIRYPSMKEVVETVYYNVRPDSNTEHYLVKKDPRNQIENSLKLKCKGLPDLVTSQECEYNWYPHENF